MNSICPSCGQAIQPEWQRCPHCGKSITPVNESIEGVKLVLLRVLDRLSNLANQMMGWIEKLLRRLPFYERLAPHFGFRQLRRYRRWITLAALLIPLLLGLYPSPHGHIDTTPFIYQFMALLSYFNPVLGIIGGVAFGVGDFLEKLITNQIYGMTSNIGDYVGARIGYIVAYSSVILMGVLPGLLARIFQSFARRLAPRSGSARSGSGMGAAGTGFNWLEAAAGVVGGMLGGGIAGGLAIPLNFPAFYLRPNPDVSCYAAAVTDLTRLIPASSLSGGLGPALDAGSRVLKPGSRIPGTSGPTTSGAGTGPKTTGIGTATSPAGPTTDRIYDGKDAVRILKDMNIYEDIKNLDHDDPDYWDKFDRIIDKGSGDRRVVGTNFDRGEKSTGPINMDDIVIIVREPAQPPQQAPPTQPAEEDPEPTQPAEEPPTAKEPEKTVPPQVAPLTEDKPTDEPKPPTPKEFLDKWQKRLRQVRDRIRFLENEKKRFEREYAKRFAQWELCTKSAVSDGIVDIADIFLSTIGKISTSGFWQAAGKDVAKKGIKNAIKEYLKPKALIGQAEKEEAMRLLQGLPLKNDSVGWSTMKEYVYKPIGIGFPPSGGLKQVLQDAVTKQAKSWKQIARQTGNKALKTQYKRLKNLNAIFGVAESAKSLVQQTKSYMAKCENLRKGMGGIRNRISNINSVLEDSRMDEAEALAAVRAGEKPY